MVKEAKTNLPAPAAKSLRSFFTDSELIKVSAIDVVVTLDESDLNLRNLSRFLQLVDQSYGRLVLGDLKKYAWDKETQLKISRMEAGSWELTLSQILSIVPDPTGIIIIYLLLKYLPKGFQNTASAISKLATAYNEIEQGRLARVNRKILRAQLANDEELKGLSIKHQAQVAEVIDKLIRQDPGISNAAQRFSEKSVREVRISIREERERD